MRATVSSSNDVTQTAPSPAAMPAGMNGSGILVTASLTGSTRQTLRP